MRYEESAATGCAILDWGTPPEPGRGQRARRRGRVGRACDMRHRKAGRQLRRTSEQRLALAAQPRDLADRARRDRDDGGQGEGAAAVRREADHQGRSGARCTRAGSRRAHVHVRRAADTLFQERRAGVRDAHGRLHAHPQDRPPQGRRRRDGAHRADRRGGANGTHGGEGGAKPPRRRAKTAQTQGPPRPLPRRQRKGRKA